MQFSILKGLPVFKIILGLSLLSLSNTALSVTKVEHIRHSSSKVSNTSSTNKSKGYSPFKLSSQKVLVLNQEDGKVLYAKNSLEETPIASVTKLMTAVVLQEAKLNPDELLAITAEDIDTLKYSSSRLGIGSTLSREKMFNVALVASENRATNCLARTAFKGGLPEFVDKMNAKAKKLGMAHTYFYDSTGLNSGNTSTAEDLAKLVAYASNFKEILEVSSQDEIQLPVAPDPSRPNQPGFVAFKNTNELVRNHSWDITLSKTGFTNEAGRCLVMRVIVKEKPVILVLLDASGSKARTNDANKILTWLENSSKI